MYKKHTLKNNVRVILSPLKDTKTVTVLVLFGVGSRYEEKKINGISHFIEHMMFKGTKKRPNTLAISKELDGVGAEYNAYTSKDVTGYWIKMNYENLPLALDIVSDMLYNSKFDSTEIEREKNVICEEMHMYRDNPIMYVDTLLEKIMFEPSSLGWDIGGEDEIIRSLTREDMVKYRDAHYYGKNLVVGIAGNVKEEDALTLVQKHFGDSWGVSIKNNTFTKYKTPTFTKPKLIVHEKETEQVQLDMGFHAYHYGDPKIYAASLLAIILGGTMSSRLFISVRERLGLCYSIRASHQAFQDTGVFSVQSGLDKTRINKAIKVILSELKKIRDKGVTAVELKRAKDYVKGKMALQFEDSENVVSWYVSQEVLTNKVCTPEEKLEKLAAVTKEQIQEVAQELFQTKKIHLAIIGPYKNGDQFEPLLEI